MDVEVLETSALREEERSIFETRQVQTLFRVQWLGAGVRLVWVLYPETQRVQVHRADGTVTKLRSAEQLTGEDVIPGFQCQVAEVFQGL